MYQNKEMFLLDRKREANANMMYRILFSQCICLKMERCIHPTCWDCSQLLPLKSKLSWRTASVEEKYFLSGDPFPEQILLMSLWVQGWHWPPHRLRHPCCTFQVSGTPTWLAEVFSSTAFFHCLHTSSYPSSLLFSGCYFQEHSHKYASGSITFHSLVSVHTN